MVVPLEPILKKIFLVVYVLINILIVIFATGQHVSNVSIHIFLKQIKHATYRVVMVSIQIQVRNYVLSAQPLIQTVPYVIPPNAMPVFQAIL
jgi:hypothetical protein